jgi:hypothetical protein
VPPLTGGVFLQNFLEVILFGISLMQVVSYVKNSARARPFFAAPETMARM